MPWAYMDPTVKSCQWDGPTWLYESRNRQAEARVPLTVELHSGAIEYWDAVDDRKKLPSSVPVKREHSRLEGRAYRLFDTAFVDANAVEIANRRNGYFLLVNATRNFDLKPLEVAIVLAVHPRSRTLGELAQELGQSPVRIRAAALSLWRQGRVTLPMGASLLSDESPVKAVQHA